MQFKGLHWIEASAGTGKTYTLSSLMVRIFLKDYLPNQVIATTFTRAAAAELKSRIRARLLETQQYIDQCLNQSLDQRALAEENCTTTRSFTQTYFAGISFKTGLCQFTFEVGDCTTR